MPTRSMFLRSQKIDRRVRPLTQEEMSQRLTLLTSARINLDDNLIKYREICLRFGGQIEPAETDDANLKSAHLCIDHLESVLTEIDDEMFNLRLRMRS